MRHRAARLLLTFATSARVCLTVAYTMGLQDEPYCAGIQSTTDNSGMPPLTGIDWNLGFETALGMDTSIGTLNSDFLFGPEKAVEPVDVDPADLELACMQGLTSTERRAHSNRLAQRRSRVRKQALAQSAKAQLAINSAELQQLQSRQKALEAHNNLLEKVVQLGQKQQQLSERAQKPVVMVGKPACIVSCSYSAEY